jgi:hypothetical protein
MTQDDLGEALRSRLARKCRAGDFDGDLPGARGSFLENLGKISHENLISGFLRCSICGRMGMPVEQAVRFAAHCKNADEWISFLAGWQRYFGKCSHDVPS